MVCRVNFGCHLVLVEPCQSGLADRLELAHLGGERGEDGGGEGGVLLVLWVPSMVLTMAWEARKEAE